MSDVSRAVDLFRTECACSQAILAVYGEPFGLNRAHAMKIASGFGGGMRMGEICGAITGSLMVLGLRHYGTDCDTKSGREKVYAAVTEFFSRFEKRNGSAICRDLLGCDITTSKGSQAAVEQGLFEAKCPKFVQDAAEILEGMLQGS